MSTPTGDTPLLIAEDDDDDFFFFRRAVRATTIDRPIVRFRNGAEFVGFIDGLKQKPSAEHPWLFFVDISMPIMNGFDVLSWLQARQGQLNIRAIMLSGSDREEDIARARALGAQDYLVKPITATDLTRLAGHYLKAIPA